MEAVTNKGIDPELFDIIVSINTGCNYHNMMKIYLVSLAPGEAFMKLPVLECHINPQNVAHGGVAFSLVDTAMGMAIRTYNTVGATAEINLNYLRPIVLSDIIYSTGRVIHLGTNLIVVEGDVTNQKGQLIAVSRATYYNRRTKLVNNVE